MDNQYVRETLRRYLNDNKITQKDFSEKIGTTQSKLSNYLNNKSGDYSWLEPAIRRHLEINTNYQQYNLKITDSTKEKIILTLKTILSNTDKRTFQIKEDDNWDETYIENYFDSLNIRVKIQNYNKIGLYTDTSLSVTVDITISEKTDFKELQNILDKLSN